MRRANRKVGVSLGGHRVFDEFGIAAEFPDKCSQVHAPQLDECRSSLQETRQTVKNERLRSEQERRSADAVRAKLSELTKQNTRLLQELREVRERQ